MAAFCNLIDQSLYFSQVLSLEGLKPYDSQPLFQSYLLMPSKIEDHLQTILCYYKQLQRDYNNWIWQSIIVSHKQPKLPALYQLVINICIGTDSNGFIS